MKTNPFIKPSGKLKGSQTMATKGDKKGQGSPKNTYTNPKSKVMASVMKKYPNTYGMPNPKKVVPSNEAARDDGSSISQKGNKRSLKFIGK